jgi:hypothetical protein
MRRQSLSPRRHPSARWDPSRLRSCFASACCPAKATWVPAFAGTTKPSAALAVIPAPAGIHLDSAVASPRRTARQKQHGSQRSLGRRNPPPPWPSSQRTLGSILTPQLLRLGVLPGKSNMGPSVRRDDETPRRPWPSSQRLLGSILTRQLLRLGVLPSKSNMGPSVRRDDETLCHPWPSSQRMLGSILTPHLLRLGCTAKQRQDESQCSPGRRTPSRGTCS